MNQSESESESPVYGISDARGFFKSDVRDFDFFLVPDDKGRLGALKLLPIF